MDSSSLPTAQAASEPVVGQIVADIAISKAGEVALPPARFKFWADELHRKYPRAVHPRVYQMLGGMAFEFAKKKTTASVQLFALATMGLPAPESAAMAKQAGLTDAAQKAATKLRDQASKGTQGGLSAPKGKKGSTLRPGKR